MLRPCAAPGESARARVRGHGPHPARAAPHGSPLTPAAQSHGSRRRAPAAVPEPFGDVRERRTVSRTGRGCPTGSRSRSPSRSRRRRSGSAP
ncbi:hypothetical protein TU94_18080 [Streptomyces cyaneogriseus subsp. noncyanogenus]|uniref:Uncharacterized protein n=1 Tax=Streptomyces cyaneogriseus subsp. noncyanogenus TaxID=477245 RepID=A0A0C5GFD5_9ACTN|nr:hypothetical protein TU94_18080 [Streptomyces cyaneogriseus subsp. noncyanogenus]